MFYKGLKIEGLELSLRKKNAALFYDWEETRHENQGKERQIKIEEREKELVAMATLRLHQHHVMSWKEGLTNTMLTTLRKVDIKDRRKSQAVPP